jgi:DNA-directed RNA polymerase specialized sigma24 family protein
MIIDLALPTSPRIPMAAVRVPPAHTPQGGDGLPMQRWLAAHKDAMFRWAMALAGTPPMGSDLAARRTFAETAVALQRLDGPARVISWLFGESLLAAQRHADQGVLPETLLAGLPPELRAVLRLVARGDLRAEEAWALLPQHMGFVRRSLVQTRLSSTHARPLR